MCFPRIDPFTMSTRCMTSDNGVLFRRGLLDVVGGMREELQAHEDWSLWLRMMAVGRWTVLPYATNCFVNPASLETQRVREQQYAEYDGLQREDEMLVYPTTPQQLAAYFQGTADDFSALVASGELSKRLQEEQKNQHIASVEEFRESFERFRALVLAGQGGRFTAKEFHAFYCGFVSHLLCIDERERPAEIKRLQLLFAADACRA